MTLFSEGHNNNNIIIAFFVAVLATCCLSSHESEVAGDSRSYLASSLSYIALPHFERSPSPTEHGGGAKNPSLSSSCRSLAFWRGSAGRWSHRRGRHTAAPADRQRSSRRVPPGSHVAERGLRGVSRTDGVAAQGPVVAA